MKSVLGLLSVEGRVAQVDHDEVDLGAAGQHTDASFGRIGGRQALGQRACAVQRAL